MKLLKKFYQIIIICFLTLLTSCSTSFYSVEQIISNNKLYVVTNAEFAPFEYKEGKVLKGIDIDIIKEYGQDTFDLDYDNGFEGFKKSMEKPFEILEYIIGKYTSIIDKHITR